MTGVIRSTVNLTVITCKYLKPRLSVAWRYAKVEMAPPQTINFLNGPVMEYVEGAVSNFVDKFISSGENAVRTIDKMVAKKKEAVKKAKWEAEAKFLEKEMKALKEKKKAEEIMKLAEEKKKVDAKKGVGQKQEKKKTAAAPKKVEAKKVEAKKVEAKKSAAKAEAKKPPLQSPLKKDEKKPPPASKK